MTDPNDTFLSQYSNNLQSSREILLNIVRLLEFQDDTIQRNMILQNNLSLRRELEQLNISRNRTSFFSRPRTRNRAPGLLTKVNHILGRCKMQPGGWCVLGRPQSRDGRNR